MTGWLDEKKRDLNKACQYWNIGLKIFQDFEVNRKIKQTQFLIDENYLDIEI